MREMCIRNFAWVFHEFCDGDEERSFSSPVRLRLFSRPGRPAAGAIMPINQLRRSLDLEHVYTFTRFSTADSLYLVVVSSNVVTKLLLQQK